MRSGVLPFILLFVLLEGKYPCAVCSQLLPLLIVILYSDHHIVLFYPFAGKLMQIWRCLTAALDIKKKDTHFELTVSRDSRILFV
jgi:hypothetical protein